MKPRRWIAGILTTSREPLPALPWARQNRRHPVALAASTQQARKAASGSGRR
jgi:hypothetical protein